MLQEEQNSVNRKEHRSGLFKHSNDVLNAPTFAIWKRAILLGVGLIGLNIVAIFVSLMCLGLPESDQSAAVNLITYSIIFLALVGTVFTDIQKFKHIWMSWKPYAFGLLLGGLILLLDTFYFQFVNLYYPIETGSNETSVRSVIDLYPVASIVIMGIIGPLCEELTYRVGLFGLLKKVNVILAYLVTGVIFGFMHFDPTSGNIALEFILLPSYIVPGIIFSLGYDLFGLPCSWTAHSLNNLWAIIAHIVATKGQ